LRSRRTSRGWICKLDMMLKVYRLTIAA
jgi:hypothetical protein